MHSRKEYPIVKYDLIITLASQGESYILQENPS